MVATIGYESNAPRDTAVVALAQGKTQRYFVERSIQDAKSELGIDKFQVINYRAWEHPSALTICGSYRP